MGLTQFNQPQALAVDASGNSFSPQSGLLFTDLSMHNLRQATLNGDVSTLAGPGTALPGLADGAGTVARFRQPFAIAIDHQGSAYVTDRDNHAIRRITAQGTGSTVVGSDSINVPGAIAIDPSDHVYAIGWGVQGRFVRILPDGSVQTIAAYDRDSNQPIAVRAEAMTFNNAARTPGNAFTERDCISRPGPNGGTTTRPA